MLYLFEIYGLVIVAVGLAILALYIAALLSTLAVKTLLALTRHIGSAFAIQTTFWKEHRHATHR